MGNEKGMFLGRGSREELGTPPGCHRAAAHRFMSPNCKRPGSPLLSPTVEAKSRNLNSLFTGLSGHLGGKVVAVLLGHKGLGL